MEDFNDPFYDGLTQDEKEALYLHIVVTHAAGEGGRMTKTWKRQVRDEWLTKKAHDALPMVRKIKERERAALRRRCVEVWPEMLAFIEGINDPMLALAVVDVMRSLVTAELDPQGWFAKNPPDLDQLYWSAAWSKDLDPQGDDYVEGL